MLPVVAANDLSGKARLQVAADRAADIGLRVHFVETAIRARYPGGKFAGGLGCDVIDSATGRILPVKRALWSLQDLDTLEIEAHADCFGRKGKGDLVEIDADRRAGREAIFLKSDAAK